MRVIWIIIGLFFMSCSPLLAAGSLSGYMRIHSDLMGYDIQYQVYVPQNYSKNESYPTIYVTDGPGYINQGRMITVMDKLIEEGTMKPIVAVFIDQREPDNLSNNRRNSELLCNETYVHFITDELIKTMEDNYSVSKAREDRVMQGVSFGGFNAACMGLIANDYFSGISMHSPANTRFMGIMRDEYAKYDALPIKIFMSVGNANDNRGAVKQFKKLLDEKGYDLNFIQNNKDHEWRNWRPIIDDALLTFFAID